MAKIILLNKPYGVLPQFTDADARPTLAGYIEISGVYPAGRLDANSEGLLLLTDDGGLQHRISHPTHKLLKRYWVQVEGELTPEALQMLRRGLRRTDDSN